MPGPTPPTRRRRSRVALVVFDAERSCLVRLEAQTAPHGRTRLIALEQLDSLAGASGRRAVGRRVRRAGPRPGRRTATPRPSETERRTSSSYRVRFDEAGPDGIARASTYLRYAQDVAWLHSERRGFGRSWYPERGLAWVVRAIDLTDRRRPCRPGRPGRHDRGDRRPPGDGPARAATCGPRPTGRRSRRVITDWVMTTTAGRADPGPGCLPDLVRRPPRDSFEPTRVEPGEPPRRRAPGARSTSGSTSSIRWATSTTRSTSTGWMRRSSCWTRPAAIQAVPRRYRLEYRAPAPPGATLRRAGPGRCRRAGRYRLEDDAGPDLPRRPRWRSAGGV